MFRFNVLMRLTSEVDYFRVDTFNTREDAIRWVLLNMELVRRFKLASRKYRILRVHY